MDDMRAQSAMQMIMHAGDARALAMQALDALNTFDVEGAREKLKEANKEVVEAHKIQTEAIVDETRGIPAEYSVLFCQALMQFLALSLSDQSVHLKFLYYV